MAWVSAAAADCANASSRANTAGWTTLFSFASRCGFPNTAAGQFAAIDRPPIIRQDRGPELGDYGVVRFASGRENGMSEIVCHDDVAAETREQPCHMRFSARQAAGKSDAQHF